MVNIETGPPPSSETLRYTGPTLDEALGCLYIPVIPSLKSLSSTTTSDGNGESQRTWATLIHDLSDGKISTENLNTINTIKKT